MRIELILLFLTAFIVFNIYTEGKFVKKLWTFKKYYQMVGVAIGALVIYWLIKKNPLSAQSMISTTNDYIKYLPIDKTSASIISPILDFTSKHEFARDSSINNIYSKPIVPLSHGSDASHTIGGSASHTIGGSTGETRLMNSGKKATKRSVSETKKKFVASRQNWKCGECQLQLNAWFEVDHKIRLEHGGSNHIDNLVALCRECHGMKTTIENL